MGLERQSVDTTTPAGVSFVQFMQDMAARAKLNIQVKGPDMVVVPWDMEAGRKQNTFVRPLGLTGGGNFIIGFFSPAKRVASDAEIPPALALDLLRKSARLAHGSWCLATIMGEEYLGVCETLIAQTMQPEEFYAASLALAQVADAMEKQLGTDSY